MHDMWYTIDPGISGTGIAAFSKQRLAWWENIYPKGKNFEERSKDILFFLSEHVSPYSKLYVEWPSGNFLSAKGLAAQNSSSLLKLAYLIGQITGAYSNSVLIPVTKWRGNCPKEMLWKRAERFFDKKNFKNHAGDAVAIGQYCIESKGRLV